MHDITEIDRMLDRLESMVSLLSADYDGDGVESALLREIRQELNRRFVQRVHDDDGKPVQMDDYIQVGDGMPRKVKGFGYKAGMGAMLFFEDTLEWEPAPDSFKVVRKRKGELLVQFGEEYAAAQTDGEREAVIDKYVSELEGIE